MMDLPYEHPGGRTIPTFKNEDPDRQDWYRIADDALEGITELLMSHNIAVSVSEPLLA